MLIDKLLYQRHIKRELGLDEDYTSGPWTAPNDTSYVGFFFEKDVNSFPARVRKEYEEIKQAILQREETFREMYGDDWRNVAVFQAYRMMKEAAEALADEKEERLVESLEDVWMVDKKFEFSKRLFSAMKTDLAETMKPVEVRVGDEFQVWDPETKTFVFSRKADVAEGIITESAVDEKELTDAEKKKREEIAQAIERDNPDMPMDKKMAIATAMAKKVAEEEKDENDPCWKGYKQLGMKKKNGKDVPNCVPEETKFEPKKFSEWKTIKE